mgnify:CR=1 FL=1
MVIESLRDVVERKNRVWELKNKWGNASESTSRRMDR